MINKQAVEDSPGPFASLFMGKWLTCAAESGQAALQSDFRNGHSLRVHHNHHYSTVATPAGFKVYLWGLQAVLFQGLTAIPKSPRSTGIVVDK